MAKAMSKAASGYGNRTRAGFNFPPGLYSGFCTGSCLKWKLRKRCPRTALFQRTHRLNPFVAGLWREVIAQNIGHPAETATDVEYGLVASQASFINKQLQTKARLRQEAPSHKQT